MYLQYWFATPISYVEMALILFFSVFVSVLAREWVRPKHEAANLSEMPLRDLPEQSEEAAHE